MTRPETEDQLSRWFAVTPLLEEQQVSEGSIDLRLGTHFTLTRRTRCGGLNVFRDDGEAVEDEIRSVQRHIVVPYGETIYLHPGDFLLGTTIEYVRLPDDLMAYVMGRSSWGRLGLIIATAVVVHGGFAGCITLELANEGPVPIALSPGTRICQLTVHEMLGDPDDEADQRYLGQIASAFSKIHEDKDIPVLKEIRERVL